MARVPRPEEPERSSPPKWGRGQGKRGVSPKDAQAAALRKQRRSKVFELKAATAATFEQIGRELGISGRQAKKDFKRAAEEYGQETAAEHKAKANARFDRQLSRLERALIKLLPLIEPEDRTEAPDLEAVARLTALTRTSGMITATQAKMNGAFAPVVVAHQGTVDHTIGASPAKARELIKSYFGGNVAVRESIPPGEDDPLGDRGGPTSH